MIEQRIEQKRPKGEWWQEYSYELQISISVDKYRISMQKSLNQEHIFYPKDSFRHQYAVLAKHILCQKPEMQLYQIERSFGGDSNAAKLIGVLTDRQGKQLVNALINKDLTESKVQIVLGLVGKAVQMAGSRELGLIMAVAIAAVLLIYDIKHPKKKETMETKLRKMLIFEEVDKIQAQLQAYLTCFQHEQTLEGYFKDSLKISFSQREGKVISNLMSNFRSVACISTLIARKNYLRIKILDQIFSLFQMDVQLHLCELYYKIVKSLIQIVSIGWKQNVEVYLDELKNEHKNIKKVMIRQIGKRIHSTQKRLIIEGPDKKETQIIDQFELGNESQFVSDIFEEIFKCPITYYSIDCLYESVFWLEKFSAQRSQMFLQLYKTSFEKPIQRYLGYRQQNYANFRKEENSRIRKMYCRFNKESKQLEWVTYHQDKQTKRGFHNGDWETPDAEIDFHNCAMIYINGSALEVITKKYEKVTLMEKAFIQEEGRQINYVLELKKNQIVDSVHFTGSSLCLEIGQAEETDKISFNGFISLKDMSERIGYKSGSFNFRSTDKSSKAQRLIFQDVVELEYFSKFEVELSKFTCRISSEEEPNQFLVRDQKNKEASYFCSNNRGGELITVTLTRESNGKHIGARHNEYFGTLRVSDSDCDISSNQFSVYASKSPNLEWTSCEQLPQDAQTQFYFYISQI